MNKREIIRFVLKPNSDFLQSLQWLNTKFTIVLRQFGYFCNKIVTEHSESLSDTQKSTKMM